MHIAAHAVSKITLFFAAGSIYTAAHKTEVSQLDGIGRRMPWTMGAFAIGALGMIGMPPTAGFLGKWFMLTGRDADGQWLAVVGHHREHGAQRRLFPAHRLPRVLLASRRGDRRTDHAHGEAPWPMVLALTATAVGIIAAVLPPRHSLCARNELDDADGDVHGRSLARARQHDPAALDRVRRRPGGHRAAGSRRSSITRISASTAHSASAPGSVSRPASC